MNKKTVRDAVLTGKRVLVRVDFNVPLDGEKVTDAGVPRCHDRFGTWQYLCGFGTPRSGCRGARRSHSAWRSVADGSLWWWFYLGLGFGDLLKNREKPLSLLCGLHKIGPPTCFSNKNSALFKAHFH